jgi:apolipoprotein N-acyltransferase
MAQRLTWMTLALCVLAVVAAVLSFAGGSWPFGIFWVLIVGLTSNLAIFRRRRASPRPR